MSEPAVTSAPPEVDRVAASRAAVAARRARAAVKHDIAAGARSPLDVLRAAYEEPEGVEGRVAYKGSVVWVLQQLVGGVRASMGYTGCASVEELRTRARFVEITAAGMRESHVHDVQIVKEAPNYRAE